MDLDRVSSQRSEIAQKLAAVEAEIARSEAQLAASKKAAAAAGSDANQPKKATAARITALKAQLQRLGKASTASQRREAKLAKQLAKNEAEAAAATAEAAGLLNSIAEREKADRNGTCCVCMGGGGVLRKVMSNWIDLRFEIEQRIFRRAGHATIF